MSEMISYGWVTNRGRGKINKYINELAKVPIL